MSDAILATVLLVPTPMDTVSPVSSFTRRLSSRYHFITIFIKSRIG